MNEHYKVSSLVTQAVSSSNETLRKRVVAVLDIALSTVSSLTESFTSGVSVPEEVTPSKETPRFADEITLQDVEPINVRTKLVDGGVDLKKTSGYTSERGEEGVSDESDYDTVLEIHG